MKHVQTIEEAVVNEGERYLPNIKTYNAAMHLGHMASYREALRYSYGRRVLDLGCGVGYGSLFLASYGARQVTAVDVSLTPLLYARQTYPHRSVEHLQADGLSLPLADHSFDFVFSSQVIEHVPSVDQFLREVRRVLTPQGFCLIVTPNQALFSPQGETHNPHHLNEMSWGAYRRRATENFPRTWFRGIPQRCLHYQGDHPVPVTKPNREIRMEDYRVQDEHLEKCENMLFFGHQHPQGQFLSTLPVALSPVAEETAPVFWDNRINRWVVLGVYADDLAGSPFSLGCLETLEQRVHSPYPYLYRVDLDLAEPLPATLRLTFSQLATTGQRKVIVSKSVMPMEANTIQLTFEPIVDSGDRDFLIELKPQAGKLWGMLSGARWRLPASAPKPLLPSATINGRGAPASLTIRTLHASLPEAVSL